jgi:hypothetical protein
VVKTILNPQPASAVEPPRIKPVEVAPAPPPPIEKKAPATAPVRTTAVIPAANSVAPSSSPVQPTPKPVTVAPPAPPVVKTPTVDPVDQARALWRSAIDAEGKEDFREAIRCYEQIKKLPADVQPDGLEVRLEMARKQKRS